MGSKALLCRRQELRLREDCPTGGAVELIEALFAARGCEVLGADVNEIVSDSEGSLTEFSAALTATKIVACHILAQYPQKG